MTTIAQLRRLAQDCRTDREKVMIDPDVLDDLLNVVESPDVLDLKVVTR